MDILKFLGTAAGAITVLALLSYWVLHTRYGKSIGATWWYVITAVLFVFFMAPLAVSGFFKGAIRVGDAYESGMAEFQASGQEPLISGSDVDKLKAGAQDFLDLGGSDSGNSGAVYVVPDGSDSGSSQLQPTAAPTVYRLRQDALQKWVEEKIPNPRPVDWLTPDVASSSILPKGKCNVKMTANGAKVDEKWEWVCTSSTPGVTAYTFTTNGYIARDSRIFDVSDTGKDGTDVFGTGDWKSCTSCWEVDTSAAQPAAQPTAQPAAQPTAQPATATTYKVTDASGGGAFWYTPVTVNGQLSCVGVSHTKAGVILFGTTVTVSQTFSGAGWVTYLGSRDLVLTTDGKCVFSRALAVSP